MTTYSSSSRRTRATLVGLALLGVLSVAACGGAADAPTGPDGTTPPGGGGAGKVDVSHALDHTSLSGTWTLTSSALGFTATMTFKDTLASDWPAYIGGGMAVGTATMTYKGKTVNGMTCSMVREVVLWAKDSARVEMNDGGCQTANGDVVFAFLYHGKPYGPMSPLAVSGLYANSRDGTSFGDANSGQALTLSKQ